MQLSKKENNLEKQKNLLYEFYMFLAKRNRKTILNKEIANLEVEEFLTDKFKSNAFRLKKT